MFNRACRASVRHLLPKHMFALLLCAAVIAAVSASERFPPHARAVETLPADVRAFIEKRQGCDHMRGELPDQSAIKRITEVIQEIDKLCKGTDRQLAGLKRRYATDCAVLLHLNQFETQIEALQLR